MYTVDRKLEAVNYMLMFIGRSPINSFEDDTQADVSAALALLTSTSRSVQSRRWSWNTFERELTPDSNSGKIMLNNAYLFIEGENGELYSVVNSILMDMKTGKCYFTAPVKVTVVMEQDFNDLPEPAQVYIKIAAAKAFQMAYQGDPHVDNMLAIGLMQANRDLMSFEAAFGNFNTFH